MKRLFDVVVATIILLALAPVVALVALAIGYKLGWRVWQVWLEAAKRARLEGRTLMCA